MSVSYVLKILLLLIVAGLLLYGHVVILPSYNQLSHIQDYSWQYKSGYSIGRHICFNDQISHGHHDQLYRSYESLSEVNRPVCSINPRIYKFRLDGKKQIYVGQQLIGEVSNMRKKYLFIKFLNGKQAKYRRRTHIKTDWYR